MHSDNPLIFAILDILRNTQDSLSLYKLIKILEKSGYDLVNCDSDESNELTLYRKNFVVMNALYQLKSDLYETGLELFISSLKIELFSVSIDKEKELSVETTDEALSKYYLDWDNYHMIDEKGVEKLLDSFWNCFSEYEKNHHNNDKRLDSLQVLGLESSASWKDIQQTYRQLITVYHPDKGGDSLKFIKIREAYLILKFTLNKSH